MDPRIREILERSKTVAVVGLSDNPLRPSYGIAMTLVREGYTVLPVNPMLQEWNGKEAYPDLLSVPVPIDIVNVFRSREYVPEIVEQAIEVKAKALWLQTGIVHEEAALRALEAGLDVVMDRCIGVEVSV